MSVAMGGRQVCNIVPHLASLHLDLTRLPKFPTLFHPTRVVRGGDGALFIFRREESPRALMSNAEREVSDPLD